MPRSLPITSQYRFLFNIPPDLAQAAKDRADSLHMSFTEYLKTLLVNDLNGQNNAIQDNNKAI
jgi:hypothetical protein